MTPSYGVEKTEWPILTPVLDRNDDGWFLQSNAPKLSVSNDGFLMFYDSTDQLVRSDPP